MNIKTAWMQWWRDEAGVMNAASTILMTAIIVMGGIVGLATYRDAATQVFGDLALALEKLDQSYSYSVGTLTSLYTDAAGEDDPLDDAPACIDLVSVPASPE